jgi:hypothetical protein
MGRPKKTIEDLPPNWEEVIGLYDEGASDTEVKVTLGLSNDLWARLVKEEPEFSEAVKRGREKSKAWWERTGRIALRDKEFSFTGWYMNMKNRFGWRDKHEVEVEDKRPITFPGGLEIEAKPETD